MLASIEEVLAALNRAEVRYLVVGGVAVLLHGHLRPIAGLELFVQLEPDNAGKSIAVMFALGFKSRAPVPATSFADPAARKKWAREKGLKTLPFWSPSRAGFPVDFLIDEPFDFEAAFGRAHKLPVGATFAQVPSITDLITLQRSAGQLDDVKALEALRNSPAALREAPPVEAVRDTYKPRSPG